MSKRKMSEEEWYRIEKKKCRKMTKKDWHMNLKWKNTGMMCVYERMKKSRKEADFQRMCGKLKKK